MRCRLQSLYCWRDKSSNAWQKTGQTVRVLSADVKNAVGTRPQLPTARKSWNRSTKLAQIHQAPIRCQSTLVNQDGGLEHNSLMDLKPMQIADVVEFPYVGANEQRLFGLTAVSSVYTVAYTNHKTVAVIQAAANESMYERLNCVWRQLTSHLT